MPNMLNVKFHFITEYPPLRWLLITFLDNRKFDNEFCCSQIGFQWAQKKLISFQKNFNHKKCNGITDGNWSQHSGWSVRAPIRRSQVRIFSGARIFLSISSPNFITLYYGVSPFSGPLSSCISLFFRNKLQKITTKQWDSSWGNTY